jgi:hypothetical protein
MAAEVTAAVDEVVAVSRPLPLVDLPTALVLMRTMVAAVMGVVVAVVAATAAMDTVVTSQTLTLGELVPPGAPVLNGAAAGDSSLPVNVNPHPALKPRTATILVHCDFLNFSLPPHMAASVHTSSSANRNAIAAPIPFDAPVTSAT